MTGWGQRLHDHPSAVLLVGQLLGILTYPFLGTSVAGRLVLGVVGLALVALAMWAVHESPAVTWVGVLLGGPAMVLTVWEAFAPGVDAVVLLSALFHAPFYFYVSWAMIRYLFADSKVTHDELFATGAAFTVVAWGFAYLYAAVQIIWPGSFVGPDPGDQTWFALLFASFASLTGVGLSDVLPATAHARALVMVEQVAGVMYLALVVSRLVGLTTLRGVGASSDKEH